MYRNPASRGVPQASRFGFLIREHGFVLEPEEEDAEMTGAADKPMILIADDDEVVRNLLSEIVADQGYIFDTADDGGEALELLSSKHYDIILTDLQMPGATGLDVLRVAKERSPMTEVVILTGFSSEEAAINAIKLGAFDYLKKPLMDIDRIPNVIYEIRKKQRTVMEKENALQHLLEERETLSAKKSELQEIAITDPLTGLYNRRYFTEQLREHYQKSKIYSGYFSLLLVDLDNFKQINDTYGHQVGDHVLSETAVILKTSVRSGDILCRFGGDEFVLLLKNTDAGIAHQIAERIRQNLETHAFDFMGQSIRCTASIGICSFPEIESEDETEMFHFTDRAMYLGKKRGKNTVIAYDNSLSL